MNNLLVRSIAGLLFLMFMLALALFVSAGTLAYWQGWLFLPVFGVCVLFVTLYLYRYDQRLLTARTQAGPVAETQASQKIIQSFASLFFIAMFIVPGLDYRFGWSQVPAVVSLIAAVFVALGLFIVFLVFRENTYTSAVIEVVDQQKVITTGPYSVVRHPMYAGASLMLLAAPICLGSWIGIVFALPLIAVVMVRAVDEEKFLGTNLVGFTEYQQKVHSRMIPGIW